MDDDSKMKVKSAIAYSVEIILNKTSWTGRDLGYLAIANAGTKFRQALGNEKTFTPLVDSTRLQEMVDTLSGNDKELKIYGNYTAMYSWILKRCQTAGVMMLKAKMECQHLFSMLYEAIIVEDALKCVEDSLEMECRIRSALKRHSFDEILTGRVDEVISRKSNLIKDIYYVFGINTIIDLIARAHKLPPVSMFKLPDKDICDSIDKLKDKMLDLQDKSLDASYLSVDDKRTRCDFIAFVLNDLDYRLLKIPSNSKQKINRIIKNFEVFNSNKKTNELISLACSIEYN